MSIRDTFRNAAVTAGNVFESVYSSCRYESYGSSVYDASAGVASVTTSSYVTSVLFTKYNQKELESDKIAPTDAKGIVAQLDLTPLPNINDSIYRLEAYGSTQYEVLDIRQDPSDALWILQLRSRGKATKVITVPAGSIRVTSDGATRVTSTGATRITG